jgi:hypothetical protein
MDKRFTYRYFDGLTDDTKRLLQSVNCLVRSGYELYRFSYDRDISHPAITFLTDITPYVVCPFPDADHIKLIAFQDLTLNTELYKTTVFSGTWKSQIRKLENLLNEGQIVLLEAEIFDLPFHVEYRGEAFFSHHRFPIVGHDNQNFYYVEPPWELNDNYAPLADNNTIGIISKDEMRGIVNDRLHFIRVQIKNNGYYDERNWFKLMLQRSVDSYTYTYSDINELGHNPFSKQWIKNYHHDNILTSGKPGMYYIGKNAIAQLTRLICELEVPLNKIFQPSPDKNLLFWYTLVVGRVLGKRFTLSKAMAEYTALTDEVFDSAFIQAVDASVQTWNITIAIMIKKIITKDFSIDSMLKKRVLTLSEIERELIVQIARYLENSNSRK